jgi:hypothetical protein
VRRHARERNAGKLVVMFPFFELHDPALRGGVASSGPSPRVAIVDGSHELEKWTLCLALPPPGVLFLRGRDARTVRDDRLTCAVGAGYLPKLADVTLALWVERAAAAAERHGFTAADADALLDALGLRFLGRTALAHLPEAVRARASLAAALASNRPILVADATTGFAMLDRDASESAAWERWCAGREVILFLPKGAPGHVFEARGWVVVDEASPHGAAPLGWRVRASAESAEVASALEAEGLRCVRDDGEVFVPRAEGASVPRIALALKHRGFRLREAALVPLPNLTIAEAVEPLGSSAGSMRP